MKSESFITIFAALVSIVSATSWQHRHQGDAHLHGMWRLPGGDRQNVPTMGNASFEQPIDHNNPDLGTFEQWFMYDTTYYKGPGSPVVLFTPGEVNASLYTSYLTTSRTTGVVAKEIGAAIIVLEHRYWGYSSPYADLTTANLQYLTLDNVIRDFTRFATQVALPFDRDGSSNAQNAPWVMIGGSYSGNLAAWIEHVDPGVIWAYHSSSAPTESIIDYWGYFLPVQEGMPKNCSKDVNLVIEHMDNVLTTGTDGEIADLKARFGLESVEHNDDFMAALEWAPWLWQGNQFYQNTGFYDWCDYIENAVNETDPAKIPGGEGVGLEKALDGYARWGKEYYFPDFCRSNYGYYEGGLNTECFDTYNKSNTIFTDRSLSNTVYRQWVWMTCNEPFGYFQTGAPEGRPTIVSRLVDDEYWIRQCDLYFPPGPNGETFGLNKGKTAAAVNAYDGGWFITNSTRLQYANGEYDPWRSASVSSELRPGGPLQSTEQVPVRVVPGGFHTSDLVTRNGEVNAECKAVIDASVAQLVEWVTEWPAYKHRRYWEA